MTFSVEYGSDAFLRWDNDREEFEVTRDLPVLWKVDGKINTDFTVEVGLFTDLASIPRWATAVVPKLGHHLRAAVVHDWTYRRVGHENLLQEQADLLFLHGMIMDRVSKFQRRIMYRSVRLGGYGSWKSKRKEIGEDENNETIADS